MPFDIVYQNDFSAPLGAEWFSYNGRSRPAVPPAGGTPRTRSCRAARLVLRGLRQPDGSYHTAGVSLPHVNVTYGRVRFRGRFDKGLGLKMCALLWPAAGFQPPEIDFAESRTEDADRTTMCMTLHYPPTSGYAIRHEIALDFSQWHTWGVTWMPGHLSCTVDNRPGPSSRTPTLGQGRGSDDADALRNSDHDGVARQGEAGRDDAARGQPAHRRRDGLELRGLKQLYQVQVFQAISRSSAGTASGSTRVSAAGASERRKSTTPA